MHFSSIICSDYINSYGISICISADYNVYSFGFNKYRSHGHEEEQINIPKQINNLTNIKMIDCGTNHSIFLNFDGNVFSFGNNNYGQLGVGKDKCELEQTHIPQKINLPFCKQVSCGNEFTICLTEDNRLYSFGMNSKNCGQLGLGNYNNYNLPQLIPYLHDIEFFICGGSYSICKTYNNEFYSWGSNGYGQLGQGNKKSCNKPIQCLNWPDNIISIKAGSYHSLLLTSEGQVYSVGRNTYGELGINDNNISNINIPTLIPDISEIQRIECGYCHSMCIDINNNLLVFGLNDIAQLGLENIPNFYKPIIHPTLSNIIDISSRGHHTFIKTIDNKIYAFGDNKHSQLGIKTSKEIQYKPIQVFQDNEDIWCSTLGKNKAKSARK